MNLSHSKRGSGESCAGSCLQELFFTSLLAVIFVVLMAALLTSNPPAQASPSDACHVSSRFPAKILQWCETITLYAGKSDLHPDLVAALIWQESGGNARAYSRSGAVGLMQVMPRDGIAEKFQCKNGPCFANRPAMQELNDPEFNIAYGTQMLHGLVNYHGGDMRAALKSYGPMDAGFTYADTVLALFHRYKQD